MSQRYYSLLIDTRGTCDLRPAYAPALWADKIELKFYPPANSEDAEIRSLVRSYVQQYQLVPHRNLADNEGQLQQAGHDAEQAYAGLLEWDPNGNYLYDQGGLVLKIDYLHIDDGTTVEEVVEEVSTATDTPPATDAPAPQD